MYRSIVMVKERAFGHQNLTFYRGMIASFGTVKRPTNFVDTGRNKEMCQANNLFHVAFVLCERNS